MKYTEPKFTKEQVKGLDKMLAQANKTSTTKRKSASAKPSASKKSK